MSPVRIGHGFDVHAFGAGDGVWLGNIRIPHDRGVVAHSDGDVVLHALCDALLGALALGDIGQHFPPSDPRWRGADSAVFVAHVLGLVQQRGYTIGNVDITVLAERPRVGPHRDTIRARIAALLGCDLTQVSVKATTTEKLGFTGREEGIAAEAVVLLVAGAGCIRNVARSLIQIHPKATRRRLHTAGRTRTPTCARTTHPDLS